MVAARLRKLCQSLLKYYRYCTLVVLMMKFQRIAVVWLALMSTASMVQSVIHVHEKREIVGCCMCVAEKTKDSPLYDRTGENTFWNCMKGAGQTFKNDIEECAGSWMNVKNTFMHKISGIEHLAYGDITFCDSS
mmetsp:Transcript_15190/g.46777  ORF Transcript_15190/g.46777 Transcript_15190/m.46777 type:complete len:134 (+) Transcript_15190:14-415(+)